mgnify:CR=1 FL=1
MLLHLFCDQTVWSGDHYWIFEVQRSLQSTAWPLLLLLVLLVLLVLLQLLLLLRALRCRCWCSCWAATLRRQLAS